MDCVSAGQLCRRNYLFDIEIRLFGWRTSDWHCLVRPPDMQRIAIEVGIDCHALNTHLTACAQDAHGDFAAIGNEYPGKSLHDL
jgi:hypothetical protein